MAFNIINPDQPFLDTAGKVRAFGTITVFNNKTTVKASITSDADLLISQANPFTLDAYGRIPSNVTYTGLKTISVANADGSDVRLIDDVASISGADITTTNESAIIFAGPTVWNESALADLKWDDTNKRFSINVSASLEALHLQDGNLLVTPGSSSAQGKPVSIGSVTDSTNLGGINSICIVGNYTYTANRTDNSVRVIDITNPTTPAIVGVGLKDDTNLAGAWDVVSDGKYIYVSCNLDNSLRIIDITNPGTPVIVGAGLKDNTNLAGVRRIYLSGQYIYACATGDNSLQIIDISNPTTPVIVGSVKDNANLASIEDVFVVCNYAYVVNRVDDSLRIIDISDPTSPTIVGAGLKDATNLNGANSIIVTGLYAYISTTSGRAIVIVDVSDPTTPVQIGSASGYAGEGFAVAGDYAYVGGIADGWAELSIYDISTPASPVRVGSVLSSNPAYLSIAGKYLYTANAGGKFGIYSIAGIKAPSASIGSLASTQLHVQSNSVVGNNLTVGGGLNVGQDANIGGGLVADGITGRQPTVASVAALPLVGSNNSYIISGTNNVTSITSVTSGKGRQVVLIFQDVLTFTDGDNLKLAGNFVTSADDTIFLACDGTDWYEISRSAN